MPKFVINAMMDAGLSYLSANVTELYVCSGNPTTRAEAITNALASRTGLTSGAWTGPANGDVSGRKITKNAETGISITTSGSAEHVVLCSGSTLILKTTVSTQSLTSGGTVDVNAFDDEIAAAA